MLALFRLGATRCFALASRSIRRMRARTRRATALTPEARGLKLLKCWLSVEQRSQFERDRCFEVTGCDTGKRYRIHYGFATNIHELNSNGFPDIGLCFAPQGCLVPGDAMLAQKIALETDELVALAVAKNFPVKTPAGSLLPGTTVRVERDAAPA